MKKLMIAGLVTMGWFVVSCNKNQKQVKLLEGSWKLIEINDITLPDTAQIIQTYENCKLKENEYCNVTTTDYQGNNPEVTEYKVVDDGTILVNKVDFGSGIEEIPVSIKELTDTKLVTEAAFGGQTGTFEYEKQ